MAVPGFQEFFLPVLLCLQDGSPQKVRQIADAMVKHFALTEEDLGELLSSGSPRYYNNVTWALSYLFQAGLLLRLQRGTYRITPEEFRLE